MSVNYAFSAARQAFATIIKIIDYKQGLNYFVQMRVFYRFTALPLYRFTALPLYRPGSFAVIAFLSVLYMGVGHAQLYIAQPDGIRAYNANTGAFESNVVSNLRDGLQQLALSGTKLYVDSYYDPAVGEGTDGDGAIEVYGATVESPLLSGLDDPTAITVDANNNLYVINSGQGGNVSIGKYNATTGATINASLISGLSGNPQAIVVSGNDLYITNYIARTVSEYNATTGAVINAALISDLSYPAGLAVSGNNLLISSEISNGTITEYNATTGVFESTLISNLNSPAQIDIAGNNLIYVLNTPRVSGGNYVGVYTLTGGIVNSDLTGALIEGGNSIAVEAIPEPSVALLSILGFGSLILLRVKRRSLGA